MSCEIKTLFKINDLNRVQELFELGKEIEWLDSVYFSISPTLEIIAFGHGTRLIILNQVWNREQQQNLFAIGHIIELENPNDVITSIICLPIVAQNTNAQSTSEWNAIGVGMSSGLVLFYTDFGMKIFSQQWHNEAVESIKAQSGKGMMEEIYFGYESCVCIVDGLNFFTVLHNMKQQHLRVNNHNKQETNAIHEFTVPCRKWGFEGKNLAINEVEVVGPQMLSSFDHLLNTAISGGFYAKYRSSPAQNSLVLAAGSRPYIGFHYAKEGFVQPVLADVARTVASKIKNALPSWIRGSQSVDMESIPTPIPIKQMACPFGLCDLQRTGMRVYLAPGNQLAAVTDNLGRVILVDCKRSTAVRVFKGYRKAQCSFIEVTEKKSKQQSQKQDRRRALFLVIYAPKRACLEIWPLQQGAKTAAFYVSKYGQLIYNSYNLMGASSTTKIRHSSINQHTCLFFDPSDQTIKEIQIPFYCAISDSNSKIAKDLHLIRRIKLNLKSEDLTSLNEKEILNEISMLSSNLQTNEMRIICLEMLVKNNKISPNILKSAILAIQSQILILAGDIEHDSDVECHRLESIDENCSVLDRSVEIEHSSKNQRKLITVLCDNYLKLLDFYTYVTHNATAEITEIIEDRQNSLNTIQMCISAEELDNIQKLLDLLCLEQTFLPETPKVRFRVDENEKHSNQFVMFLSSFNVQNDDLILLENKKTSQYHLIGSIIFQKFLEDGKSFDKFVKEANHSGILSEEFMRLLLVYWLEKPFLYRKSEQLIADMQRFTEILENVCLLAGNKVEYDYNSVSLWWQMVRELLLESSCALRGLLAAIMCRNQALKCSRKEKSSDDTTEEVMNFEELSQEACQWSLLIVKLDDSAVLGAILNIVVQINEPVLPIIKYEKSKISLMSLLAGGKGIVTELVTKWLAGTGLDPRMLFENTIPNENSFDATAYNESSNIHLILNNIRLLRDHFPFSLQPGILLCHLSWDFMGYWSNNMSQLNYLSAGVKCLSTIQKPDWALKHGICCMIWNAHLKMPLEATRKLIDKVGHLPREKFCLQDIGISDSLVSKFLELCIQFLENFIECLDHNKMELHFEEILQEGEIPLALLALQQIQANLDLLNLHNELLIVLQFISQFSVKQMKPKNLFNDLLNQTFFCQINKSLSYELTNPDLILVNVRKKFLYKVITATIDLIREDYEKIYYDEHIEWYGKIEHLGRKWKINENELKRHQISELYVYGWDEYGEQLLLNFCDIGDLGFKLLDIAGNRLNSYINSDSSAWGHVATVSPSLTTFLDKLSTENTDIIMNDDKPVDLDKLIKLTQQAFEFLSKSNQNQKEFKLAGLLFDACSTIKQHQ